MKKFLLFVIAVMFLASCGVNTPTEVMPEGEVSQPELIDGRLVFKNFVSFSEYWANLIEKDEAGLDAAQREGFTSQRSASKDDPAAAAFDDPALQTVLNEQGLVQVSNRVFLVTDKDVISIPSKVLSSVDLDALALSSTGSLQNQNTQGLDIVYSPIEWATTEQSANGSVEAQGIVSSAVWAFVKKYILDALIPSVNGKIDTCKRRYWKGSGIYQWNHKRRIIGVSAAVKLKWAELEDDPVTFAVVAGTGNVNAAYYPRTGTLHLNQSKNFKVTGNPWREVYSRVGTYKVSGASARAIGRFTYWVSGPKLSIAGNASTTHTASSKGKTGICHTSLSFNLR